MSVLNGLEPKSVFSFFEEFCGIPHGSGDTWKISNYLVDFAKSRQLRVIQDELGNVIIFKAGTEGYENSEPVIIQGHMDMVCEKESNCDIDFKKDGLKLNTDGIEVWADGTTLGGDDGIAVAYALAILDAKEGTIQHPPLEVVITVDEEIGMLGASAIDVSELKSRRMLNLDSEDFGVLLVSCAGGATESCVFPIEYEECSSEGQYINLKVSGGMGGHSGVEIHKQRANASKLLGRVLYTLLDNVHVHLVEVKGGLKDNAIPREATATLIVEHEVDLDEIDNKISHLNELLRHEYSITDPDLKLNMTTVNNSDNKIYMSSESGKRVVSALMLVPNGVIRMSNDIEGLVQTSLNLGILKTDIDEETHRGEVTLSFSVRSSIGSEKEALLQKLKCITKLLGGVCYTQGEYPAWEYKKDSCLRDIMMDTFEEMYGYKPKIEAIHAGVECGLFAGKLVGLDCVSYGPDIKDIHTTSERLNVESVKKTYEYTLEILKRLR
ncbi:MAG: aminoacyl-histidine dipeptidase [Wujia sp.]